MSKRFWIIAVSIAVHVGIFLAAFVSNIWKIDRLEAQSVPISLAAMLPPPAPSGGPAPGEKPREPTPPRHIAHEPTQPPEHPKAKPDQAVAETTGGGIGDSKGPGTNPDGDPTDTGTCVGLACGPVTAPPVPEPPAPPPPVVPQVTLIPPSAFKAHRTSGETAIAPPDVVKTQMAREGRSKAVGSFKICLDTTGAVSSVSTIGSTKYGAYDAKLIAGMQGWRYEPFVVDGKPTPVCSVVSFHYAME